MTRIHANKSGYQNAGLWLAMCSGRMRFFRACSYGQVH